MITEDYVSYETAKLLKEKGFDEYGMYFYTLKDEGREGYKSNDRIKEFAHNSRPELRERAVSCPTLQMAMKWLREVHKIAINIGWGEVFEENYQWWCIILNQNNGEILRESEYCKTYEQACETAIKYCLVNLI